MICSLFMTALILCWMPVRSAADDFTDTSSFATFEELQNQCAQNADNSSVSLVCSSEELVFPNDYTIPPGVTVTFLHFTVPEGVTLTVMNDAEIMTYAFRVEGELINRGTVIQQDLSMDKVPENLEIAAYIPGHVENKGEMTLTNVYGKRNIRWLGSKLTMYETETYRSGLKTNTTEPTPEPSDEVTPAPVPPDNKKLTTETVFDALEVILPRLSFLIVLAAVFLTVKTIKSASNRNKRTERSSTAKISHRKPYIGMTSQSKGYSNAAAHDPGEDHFRRDKRTRIAQLDDWLKNGLIDRKEYNELKKRYMQDNF